MNYQLRALLRVYAVVFALLALTALVGALAGCAGGDDEPTPDQPTPAVDCTANPKACT
jgi:uncharacterized protein YcgI (DUF1989 family)